MSVVASVGAALAPPAAKVNLSAAWSSFWTPVQAAIGPAAVTLITVVGLMVLLSSLGTYIFQRRRGTGKGNTSGLFWAAMFGALLIAPSVLFPLLLQLADFVVNGAISLLPAAS